METIEGFFSQFPQKNLQKGEVIIDPHQTIRGAYYVKKGHIRQYSVSPEGIEITIHIFAPHSYFPMTWVMNNIPNRYFYEAYTDVELAIAPQEKIIEFLSSHPALVLQLTSRLLNGLDKLSTRIEFLATAPASKKILAALLFFARHFGQKIDGKIHLIHKFTHRDIASFAGLTRETTSRELEKLHKLQLIQTENQIVINNLQELENKLTK